MNPEEKPLIINGLYVFAAVNRMKTIVARMSGQISSTDEIAEPIIVMAKHILIADFVLEQSAVTDFEHASKHCEISHHVLDNNISNVIRPLIKLVNNGHGLPYHLNN